MSDNSSTQASDDEVVVSSQASDDSGDDHDRKSASPDRSNIIEESVFIASSQPPAPSQRALPRYAPLPSMPLAAMPPGTRAPHDRLKPTFDGTYPNLHRVYNANSKAVAHVAWEYASAQEIWSIVTSSFLTSGSKATSNAYYKLECTKYVHELLRRALQTDQNNQIWKELTDLPALNWTLQHFNLACAQPGVLPALRQRMSAYNKTRPISIKNGLFQDATATQIDMCRVAALMVEPVMFEFLAAKSNPVQDRTHTDNKALRAKYISESCMLELTRLHNDVAFVPQANADVTHYCRDFFVSTAHPAEHRDFGWVSTHFNKIRSTMGTMIINFNQSGNLANGLGDDERDDIFWNRFGGKQPVWMYIYLLWDHGRDSTYAWNAIQLPQDQRMDIGVRADSPPPAAPAETTQKGKGGKSAKKRAVRDEEAGAQEQLLQVSTTLLKQFCEKDPTTSSSTSELVASQRAKALSDHADIIRHQLDKTTETNVAIRQTLQSTLDGLLVDLCAVTRKEASRS